MFSTIIQSSNMMRGNAGKEDKRIIDAGGDISMLDPHAGDNHLYCSSTITGIANASLVTKITKPSAIELAFQNDKIHGLSERSATRAPVTAIETRESCPADNSAISDLGGYSFHDNRSETNDHSPKSQTREADDVESEGKKRKRVDPEDDEVGHHAKKKLASQNPDTSMSINEDGGSHPSSVQDHNIESLATEEVTLSSKDLLHLEQYSKLSERLGEIIIRKKGYKMDLADVDECLEIIEVMEAKYQNKEESKKWKASPKACKHPETWNEFFKRLQGAEETEHPWAGSLEDSDIPALVMRGWDQISQCQIKDARAGFLAGSSYDMLDTREGRHVALKRHSNWGNRHKTPFISTSSSLEEIAEHRVPWFRNRQLKKGIRDNTRLTLINTRVRLAAGKPVLRMKEELLHYQVETRFGDLRRKKKTVFDNEYLLPFSCGPKEIVGTWAWHDIENWIKAEASHFEGWYKTVGIPAFKEHERVRLGGTPHKCTSGCKCCGK